MAKRGVGAIVGDPAARWDDGRMAGAASFATTAYMDDALDSLRKFIGESLAGVATSGQLANLESQWVARFEGLDAKIVDVEAASAKVAKRVDALASSCDSRFFEQSERIDVVDERSASVSRSLDAVDAKHDLLAKTVALHTKALEDLRSQLALDAAIPRVASNAMNIDYDRDTDDTILTIRTLAAVAKEAVVEALLPLGVRAGFPKPDWSVDGPALGRNFKVVFEGSNAVAARRALRFHAAQRLEDGSWVALVVKLPGDGGLGETTKLWLDMDKNKRQLREQRATKLLGPLVKAKLEDTAQVWTSKANLFVSVDGTPLVRVACPSPRSDDIVLSWNHSHSNCALVNGSSIKDDIIQALLPAHAKVQWV